MPKYLAYTLSLLVALLITITIAKLIEVQSTLKQESKIVEEVTVKHQKNIAPIMVDDTVRIADYFDFIDSLVSKYDRLTDYRLTEHLLVNANAWIIDTLARTDYYHMTQRNTFVFDQRKTIVFHPKQTLKIPDSLEALAINASLSKTNIDINLPEYKLRIYRDSNLLYTMPIRIGQNKSKYLKMGDRITNLRTKTGEGHIAGFQRDPDFYDPVTGKPFEITRRDDDQITLMPQIPWIVTEINGIRNGQLIHPTTNPKTLGKAYSNGCIGVKEGDAWIIYYHCPIGTPIRIRYDLRLKVANDSILLLDDVYNRGL